MVVAASRRSRASFVVGSLYEMTIYDPPSKQMVAPVSRTVETSREHDEATDGNLFSPECFASTRNTTGNIIGILTRKAVSVPRQQFTK